MRSQGPRTPPHTATEGHRGLHKTVQSPAQSTESRATHSHTYSPPRVRKATQGHTGLQTATPRPHRATQGHARPQVRDGVPINIDPSTDAGFTSQRIWRSIDAGRLTPGTIPLGQHLWMQQKACTCPDIRKHPIAGLRILKSGAGPHL